MNYVRPTRWRLAWATLFVILALTLAVTTCVTSARWVGTVFPGFFVLDNKVVASVSLPHWSVTSQRELYQHAVVAVNGQPVHTSDEIYATIRSTPPHSTVTYTLEKDGRTTQAFLATQSFPPGDYFLVFGAYLFTGLVSITIGIAVWVTKPGAASLALLIQTGTIGVFFLTAIDLYAPHWFFRLHVFSEALIGASTVHLALVFPVDRQQRFRQGVIAAPYVVSLALNVAYQAFLYDPARYSYIHSLCESYAGLSLLPFVGNILWHYHSTTSHLTRQRILVIILGFLGAFALPAMLAFLSGIAGGGVAVNYSVFTMSIFPLSLGYAIVKHDLFEIDIFLKRAAYYLALTTTLTVSYVGLLSGVNLFLRSSGFSQSPVFSLLYTVAAVLLLNPLKDRIQRIVDRLFFRLSYDPKKTLEITSEALASTLRLDEILPLVWNTIRETMGVLHGRILLINQDQQQYVTMYPDTVHEIPLTKDHPLIQRLQLSPTRILSSYDLDEYNTVPMTSNEHQAFADLHAQVLVPLTLKGELLGLIALGQKGSGRFFSVDDRDFLFTLANQSALSIANALSYEEITKLNAGLEKKVELRTQELADANTRLSSSLSQLEQAYRDLEHSQGSLVRAEKMAALGRLTAGIAHEMNTPLGASLNSLRLLQELVDEYTSSIGDPEVNDDDHRSIATEMRDTLKSTRDWVEKASAHIRTLKSHTRTHDHGQEVEFSILQAIEDTAMLVSHRLRLSGCTLTTACTVPDLVLKGDPGKLGQVLANLVVNSIDAYTATGKSGGGIHIGVTSDADMLELQVTDSAGGIPPEHQAKIFDELFTTKPVGKGTGLGLSISRDLITNFFGGTMHVESTVGQGSTFTLRLPRQRMMLLSQPTMQDEEPTSMPSLTDWASHDSGRQAA